ncbi:MAG TPA: YbdK family carboxylate-amine ligase [Solirubrobacterales bacterium]|nr:YbdK family carboxylate-amine ligase [Solirubrobacterales bacterium]
MGYPTIMAVAAERASLREKDRWEANFGAEEHFAIGVEEELLLVHADNRLADRGADAIEAASPDQADLDGELFKAMVESRSEPSPTAGAAVTALREARRELIGSGSRIIGAGAHPGAAADEGEIRGTPRYAFIKESLQGILRTPICGQHIHVSMPDEATAIRAYNGIRTHVPLLNAIASNSPFWFGQDSGLASARTAIFRSYPRAAMGPEFDDFDEFCRVTRQICIAGGIPDYTQIWWDVRLHPRLGTIEVRAADTQFDLRSAAAIAALVQCLARIEAERDQGGIPAREALAESCFQATRHGLDAKLIDRDGEAVPARVLGLRALELVAGEAGKFGCEDALGHAATILEEGSGADLQRRVHAERGMDGLLEYLVTETARLHE